MKITEIVKPNVKNLVGLRHWNGEPVRADGVWDGDLSVAFTDLTSLEGAPSHVNGSFNCNGNYLTSLTGSPAEIRNNFYCVKNQLTSLEGGPSEVGADFSCSQNNLTSLKGAPSLIPNDFICNDNSLTSLEGAPSSIGRDFRCARNRLTSLSMIHKHIKHIGGSISMHQNSIEGCVLGLLLIDGLKGIRITLGEDEKFSMVCDIINRYLVNTRGRGALIDCQNELLDEGLEEYAKL